jgi:type IV secretion system protein VirB10
MVSAKPAPPHTIAAWSFLYGTLETGINSDHPGDVIGRVSQDVKDTMTQTEVLIPQGSTLHGYEGGPAQVRPNDTSIIVRWDDIELPNGGHIPIPKMPGTDPEGYPGFEDLINHHYASKWIPPILISGITAGAMLATQPTYGGYQGYDAQQQATGAFTQSLAGHATGELSADINRNKPTFIIENGYHFRVLVTRDMTFDHAYEN